MKFEQMIGRVVCAAALAMVMQIQGLQADKVYNTKDAIEKLEAVNSQEILLQLSAQGVGVHTFTAKVNNLDIIGPSTVQVDLGQHTTRQISWQARVIDAASPWVAVLLPDGSITQHQELTGVAATK